MTVIIKKKTTFDTTEFTNVTNIAYNTGTKVYSITQSGTTYNFSSDDYLIAIMFK